MSIATIASELCVNIDEQSRVWRRMLELSRMQLDALQAQDVHAVHATLQELEVTMLERSRTELRRSMLLAQAAQELGVPVEHVTRDLIASRCDAPLGDALARAADELRDLVTQLDSVVARNAALLEQELSIIDVLVRGATLDTSARTTYGKHGAQQEAPRLRLLDAQV